MKLTTPKELDADIMEFSQLLCLTPRQFAAQAIEREIERLRGEKAKYLKVKYGKIYNDGFNDSSRGGRFRGSSQTEVEEHQELWSL